MDLMKFLKWHLLRGPLMRRVVLRTLMLVLAVIVVSLTQMKREIRIIEPVFSNIDECPFNFDSNPDFNLTRFSNSASCSRNTLFGASPLSCKESENLTKTVFKELMEKNLLQSNARALCVGSKSASAVLALRHLGFFNAFGVEKHPFFSLLERRFMYELDFQDNHFDFVFIEDLDRVSVPALLVLEIERVMNPGGSGAMLVGAHQIYSSFLKSSDVIHVCGVGSFSLVVFKKRLESFASFERFQLPDNCASVANNKPYMKYVERPFSLEPSYLPKFVNISSRSKLVYVNVGAGEYAKTSVAKMSETYCGDHHSAFEVFVIDHRASVLSSYVTDPGINFIYLPELSGNSTLPEITSDEFMSAPIDEEGFNFVKWFDETVSDGDFVVLMMKAELVELNILVELFKTGAICRVDELFLRCSDTADCTKTMCGADCVKVLESLRKSGVYVHQWLGN